MGFPVCAQVRLGSSQLTSKPITRHPLLSQGSRKALVMSAAWSRAASKLRASSVSITKCSGYPPGQAKGPCFKARPKSEGLFICISIYLIRTKVNSATSPRRPPQSGFPKKESPQSEKVQRRKPSDFRKASTSSPSPSSDSSPFAK